MEGFNVIGDQGAANLARSLVRNRSLRTLYLSGNSIGAAGATALAESLGRSDGLETLHLSVSRGGGVLRSDLGYFGGGEGGGGRFSGQLLLRGRFVCM